MLWKRLPSSIRMTPEEYSTAASPSAARWSVHCPHHSLLQGALVVAFDPAGGAVAASHDERLLVAPFDDAGAPLDVTGAGDAFASTMVAALIRGVPIREALAWPPVNVAAVAQRFGTQGGLLRYDGLSSDWRPRNPPSQSRSYRPPEPRTLPGPAGAGAMHGSRSVPWPRGA